MKENKIEELLVRYYNGETDEAEERELKRFFAQEEVPSHLLAEKEFFAELTTTRQAPPLPDGFENRLSALIDGWDACEKQVPAMKKRTRSARLQWIGSIAAGLLLLIAVGGTHLHNSYMPPTPKDTCKTPEEAYAQAQKALTMLSVSLNKGVEGVALLQNTTDNVEKNIQEQLNRLKSIK